MKKLLLILFLVFLSTPAQAAITYFNSASTPADNGAQSTGTVAVTPPGSMTTGDLVILWASTRNGAGTFAMSQTSGQSWSDIADVNTTNMSGSIFWCRFNGTWGADPSIEITGTGSGTVVMHVFRPSDSAKLWNVDTAQAELDFAAATTITITGFSTTNASTVTLATWVTIDDVSWINLAGTGWVETGLNQYRNTAGNDQSQTFAHFIQTSAGATGNVSKDQSTNGTDAGTSSIIAFYEYDSVASDDTLPFINGGYYGWPG